MSALGPVSPVLRTDRALLHALRADLTAAPYTVERCEGLLGPLAVDALRRENPIPARARLRGSKDPAAILHLLFELGEALPEEAARAALPSLGVDGAIELGLLTRDEPTSGQSTLVRARMCLSAYSATDDFGDIAWWIASDLSELATGRALEGEHVLGVGGASLTLARITPRRRVRRALDVGCGGGIQAMHASRHAEHVVATDLSARALEVAAFNAALNGIELELRQGSLLEPVAGERFDLIITNPPFVITPRTAGTDVVTWTYRDGGQRGDALLAQLLRDLPAHLAPGGTAHMLGNWEMSAEEEWDAHPCAWLETALADGVDAWVIQRESEDPAQYAETWARDGGITSRDVPWEQMLTAWLADFASREVQQIGFGWIALRRPPEGTARRGELRAEIAAGTGSGALAAHLQAGLEAIGALADTDSEALFAKRAVRAEDVMERRFLVPGQWDPVRIDLVQGAGLAREVSASQALAGTVGACDGTLTLGQIVDAVCALTDRDPAATRAELEPMLRELVTARILVL